MTSIAVIIHSLLSMVIVALVLMHSGRDAGLSGAFGVGQGGGSGGSTAVVERNLTRATIIASLLWGLTTFWLSRVL